MLTKEDERKALNKIVAVLEGLRKDDPQELGYVLTAFKGCVELARENIRDDAALSLQDRAELAEKRLAEAEARAAAAEKRAELYKAATFQDAGELSSVLQMVIKYETDQRRWAEENAKTILAFATTPDDIAFRDAAAHRAQCLKNIERSRAARERLELMLASWQKAAKFDEVTR